MKSAILLFVFILSSLPSARAFELSGVPTTGTWYTGRAVNGDESTLEINGIDNVYDSELGEGALVKIDNPKDGYELAFETLKFDHVQIKCKVTINESVYAAGNLDIQLDGENPPQCDRFNHELPSMHYVRQAHQIPWSATFVHNGPNSNLLPQPQQGRILHFSIPPFANNAGATP